VIDTDLPCLPHHADVFSTFPRPPGDPTEDHPTNKAVWRKERARLFELAEAGVIKKADFGRLS
jgi:hypothetical protein